MKTRPFLLLAMAGVLVVATAASTTAETESPTTEGCDFDADGYHDLAVGVPYDEVDEKFAAGSVHVIYGTADGLSAADDQVWHRGQDGVNAQAGYGDLFGSSITCGDFDGDGYDDLGVGVPDDRINKTYDAGSVQVFYGTAGGLSAARDQRWHRDRGGINLQTERGDKFGWSLASGDFDGDGHDDLAVGVPYDDLPERGNAGSVHVIYGTAEGLSSVGDQVWHRARAFVNGNPGIDAFGWSLASGDFDGDGDDDLAIGAPHDKVSGSSRTGSVQVLYGTVDGLSADGDQVWHRGKDNIDDDPDTHDNFGYSLASGNFDGDGGNDLAIGVPYDDVDGVNEAGSVQVLYGTVDGISAEGDQVWHRGLDDLSGELSDDDNLGWSLACGDHTGDGYADLAIGVPGDDVNEAEDAGSVHVIRGTATGLATTGEQILDQDQPGIEDVAEDDDEFGWSLAHGDYNGDGYSDLTVGVPSEDLDTIWNAGAVNVIYGDIIGLTSDGNQFWSRNSPGIIGNFAYDIFGRSLAP